MKLKITTLKRFDFLRGNATSRSSYHDTDNITNEHIELCTNNLQIISTIAHESFRDLMTPCNLANSLSVSIAMHPSFAQHGGDAFSLIFFTPFASIYRLIRRFSSYL